MGERQRVVLVTGAGRGIGRVIAATFASQGAAVVIAEKDEQTGSNTAAGIEASGARALFVRTDISVPSEVEAMVRIAVERFGGVDVLINNAGLSRMKPMAELSIEEWDYVINTNLRGAFICSRACAAAMKQRGGGAIVNIASTRALMSEPDSEAYAASKGGLVALTHAMALSLGPLIRVNCISPGWICNSNYDELTDRDHAQHPAGRVGTPEDIARACLFLTAPENGFITGQNFVIDGGMTKKMIYE